MTDFLINTSNSRAAFSDSFTGLLQSVKERIPVELYQLWQEALCCQDYPLESYALFHQAAKDYLMNIQKFPLEDKALWEALVYLTLNTVAKKLREQDYFPWVDGLPNIPAGNVDPDRLVLEKVNTLYDNWTTTTVNGRPTAHAYAFYLVMIAAISDTDIKRNLSDFIKLQDYFQWLDKGIGSHTNLLTEFVKDYHPHQGVLGYWVPNSDEAITHFHKVNVGNIKLNLEERPVNILIVGLQGNGKTTFIKELYHAILKDFNINNPLVQLDVVTMPDKIGGEMEIYLTPGKTRPTIADYWELTGKFKNGSKDFYDLMFNDTKGEIIWQVPPRYMAGEIANDNLPSLEKKMLTTDLLMIVIDPSLLFDSSNDKFSRLIGSVTSRLDYLFHYSKHAMFAIIFSKFDEYGVVLSGPRNLISNTNQAEKFIEYSRNPTDDNWSNLVESVTQKYGPNDASLPVTIKAILNKVKPLFTAIGHRWSHPALNAYMISIPKPSNSAEDFRKTGVPLIFEDFGNYLHFLTNNKPPTSNGNNVPVPTPKNVQIIPKPHESQISSLEVIWDMPDDFTGSFIVKRKSRNKKSESFNEWELLVPAWDNCKFTDRNLRKDYYYKYQIVAVSDRNEMSDPRESAEILVKRQSNIPIIVLWVILSFALIIAIVLLLNN